LADNPAPLNNHIYVAGQEGYQDNSGAVAFDPEKAKQELDALGWRLNGQFREKDGRQLVIRDVLFDALSTKQYAQIAQNNLAQIGVRLDLDIRPAAGFFTDFVTVGNFDIAQFAWSGDAFPLASLTQIYRTNAESNFGKISSPEIDAKIEQTVGELDPEKARALANELDKMLFDEVFSLPLTQSAGNVAVRSTLANFGALGLADADYTKIGFMKP
jgi:peptide/nickel transport system substrate-binding protein